MNAEPIAHFKHGVNENDILIDALQLYRLDVDTTIVGVQLRTPSAPILGRLRHVRDVVDVMLAQLQDGQS